MKKLLILSFITLFVITGKAQSPSFEKDAKTLYEAIKSYSYKDNYTQLIAFDNAANGSIFIEPDKRYMIFYVYDMNPAMLVNFKAYLMTSDQQVKKKYTGKATDLLVEGSARSAILKFKTPKFKEDKLPVKIEAKPNANIYVFYK